MVAEQLIRPRYGARFRCIGSDCEATCCAGWNVHIDRPTYKKYKALPAGELRSLLNANLEALSTSNDSCWAEIKLTPTRECPFQSTERLCRIQQEQGAEYLSDVCSIYPRALNKIYGELECSLDLSCPEAARLVLLDPHLMGSGRAEAPSCRPALFRTVGTENSDTENLAKDYGAFRYFAEIRATVLALLQDRSYPVWQRLFLLGMMCKRLHKVSVSLETNGIPEILHKYREMTASGTLRSAMEGIPIQPLPQLTVIVQLIDRRIKTSWSSPRFHECVHDFVQGIQYRDGASLESLVPAYVDAHERHYAPFMARREFILENYLVNCVFSKLFPFQLQSMSNPVSQNLFSGYLMAVLHYALIKGLLIGMSGHYGERFGMEQVIKLVQSFVKEIEHHTTFAREVAGLIESYSMASATGMAVLLRN